MNKDNTKNSINRQKKIAVVAELNEKVAKAKAVVLTNYTGLTHKQLETFKREIKKSDAEFAVTKNTLLKRSLTENKLEIGDEKNFDLPTGTIFLYGDIVAPLKALAKMIKDFEKPQVKAGYLEGKFMDSASVMKLSTLPSREVLIGQLVGMLQSPIARLPRALNWNLQKFAMTLNAIADKKKASA
jgi:large subunit ribosomal protein L10